MSHSKQRGDGHGDGHGATRTLEGTARHAVPRARTTLVLYHRDSSTVVHLDPHSSLVIGRAAPSDVVIPDPNLSRRHARFDWDDDGVWLEDLESTNGTKRNGKAIGKRTKLAPSDQIAIGPVIVSVHQTSTVDEALRGFDGHDRFLDLLAEELVRARTFERSLAVVLLRATTATDAGHVSRWASRLRAALRPVDRVGIYGPSAVLVALPEATPAIARDFVAAVASTDLGAAVAMFPADGHTVDELVEALHAARKPTAAGRRGAKPEKPEKPDKPDTLDGARLATSPAMRDLVAQIDRVAQSTISVLIHGETGTGKEVVAREIHERGPRRKRPLRSINCAAIPATLIESVLFGHEQGAFTGADKLARGIFEQADGGTVLLDEVGELSPNAQATLLRVLETKRLTRVGGDKDIAVDVRVLAATHRDLEAMVATNRFRQDLLYRLDTMTLRLPPLRERVDEIRPLAERFLVAACKQAGVGKKSLDRSTIAALERYGWPGNIRELRNAIERAVVLAESSTITPAELTDRIRNARPTTVASSPNTPAVELPSGDYKEHLRRYEIDLIVHALEQHGGNQTETAKALGLPLRTLVHKIQLYGIKKKFDR